VEARKSQFSGNYRVCELPKHKLPLILSNIIHLKNEATITIPFIKDYYYYCCCCESNIYAGDDTLYIVLLTDRLIITGVNNAPLM